MHQRLCLLGTLTLLLGLGAPSTVAQNAPLKGNWMITAILPNPLLSGVPLPASFKANGHGTMDFENLTVPLVYRESGADFSVSVEVPAEFSPTREGFSLIFRGTKSADNSAQGTAVMVTDRFDPASLEFVIFRGEFTAGRL